MSNPVLFSTPITQNYLTTRGQIYDILVIGGGATGLGCAVDAALRGLKVCLIEKGDFSCGTSSISTKLVHGGVRYLEKAVLNFDYGQYILVKEALHERKRMLNNAPHLAHPLGALIPIYSYFDFVYYRIGVFFYDLIAGKSALEPAKALSLKDTLDLFPNMCQKQGNKKLIGSILYYDGQFDDSAYAIALARAAHYLGTTILNYIEAVAFEQNQKGEIYQTFAKNMLTNETFSIQAKAIINCTGAWADNIRLKIRPKEQPRLRPSKGIHLVLSPKNLPIKTGLLIPETKDGRIIFILPWKNAIIIGTTDTEVKDPNEQPTVENSDIDFLIEQANVYLNKPILKQDIQSTFAGYRPLVASNIKGKTEALIRNHEIEIWEPEKVIHVLGGKWTTYRKMAEDAINSAEMLLKTQKSTCKSAHFSLNFETNNIATQSQYTHLNQYGNEKATILALIKQHGDAKLHTNYPFLEVEVIFAIQYAFAQTIEDILSRRLRIETIDKQTAKEMANPVSMLMAKHLQWAETQRQAYLNEYLNKLK